MAFKTTLDIDSSKLTEDITRLDDVSDRVRLASFGLAAPLLDLRLAQMRREVQRVAARKGADHPDVVARQAALDRATARSGRFHEELSRARLDMPSLQTETGAGLWGRVADNGVAVAGVTVLALSGAERIDFRCTDANGGFAMGVPSDTPLVLSVRSPEGAELYRDREEQSLAAGQQQYREIDLGRGAAKPCPEPPPDDRPPEDKEFPMVNLVGQTEADAMAILRAQGLTRGERTERRDNDRVGLVIAQEPEANTPVKRGDAVAIIIGTSGKVTVPSVIGLSRDEAQRALKEAGLTEGEVTFVTVAREKASLVTNQNPAASARADPGDKVALEIGRLAEQPPTSGNDAVVKVGRLAEERLRAAGIATDAPADFTADALVKFGATDGAGVDKFLAQDRQAIRDQLRLRTLAETDRAIVQIKQARSEVFG
jgi:hypothetical protein